MDEQRRQDYLELIGKLLGCSRGQEEDILKAHQSLVDEGLIEGLIQVSSVLEGDLGTETVLERSLRIAQEIALTLNLPEYFQGQSPRPKTFEEYLEYEDLLTDLLDILRNSRRIGESLPETLSPLLLENMDKINDTFAYVLKLWVENQLLTKVTEEDMLLMAKDNIPTPLSIRKAYRIASDVTKFCSIVRDFFAITTNNTYKLYLPDIAIKGYQVLETFFYRNNFVREQALVLANLGCAYRERLRGNSFKNLDTAIASFENSLKLATSINNSNIINSVNNILSDAYGERLRRIQDDIEV